MNAEVFILSTGMLRDDGRRTISRPGYAVPQSEHDDPLQRRRCRRRSREQLRLWFRSLATLTPRDVSDESLRIDEAMSNENEDLLDALAVIIDLDGFDDDKFVYFPEDFREAISVFPSSMSYGQLRCPLGESGICAQDHLRSYEATSNYMKHCGFK